MTGQAQDLRTSGSTEQCTDFPAQRPVVAQVLDIYPYRGQQYVYDLIFNLRSLHSVVVARRYQWPRDHLDRSRWRAEEVRAFARTRLVTGAFSRLAPRLGDDLFVRFVARQARAISAKLIHVHYGILASRMLRLKKLVDLPLVVSLYGSAWRAVHPEWQQRYRALFGVCDRVVVECDATAQTVLEGGCPLEKLRVLHLGIDTEREFQLVQRPSDDVTRFLIVARFIEKKGFPYLLEAFAHLAQRNSKVRLTAMGYGVLKDWIIHRASELGVGDLVEVIDTTNAPDFTRTLLDSLASHDVFVYPAVVDSKGDHEGTPVCLIAAQASGLPVIATPIGGIEEVVREGGILVPPGDVGALEVQMLRLANQPERRRLLGLSGRQYVVREFSLPRQVSRLEALYEKVL